MLKLMGKDASHKSMERAMKEIDKDGGGEVVRRTAPSKRPSVADGSSPMLTGLSGVHAVVEQAGPFGPRGGGAHEGLRGDLVHDA